MWGRTATPRSVSWSDWEGGRPPRTRYLKAVWPEIFGSVFGRFSDKLGPKTPLERRGSSCSAGCTKNQPGRPIPRPFHGSPKIPPGCLQVPPTSKEGRKGRGPPHRPTNLLCKLSYVMQYCFRAVRAGNRASGPDFGRILIGKTSTSVKQT